MVDHERSGFFKRRQADGGTPTVDVIYDRKLALRSVIEGDRADLRTELLCARLTVVQ